MKNARLKTLANGKAKISKPKKSNEAEKDLAKTYNQFKEFEGQQYTGMKIGRSHKWYYDKGEWKETKITPDLWRINYAVKNVEQVKHRKAQAYRWARSITGISLHTRTSANIMRTSTQPQ